MAEITTAGFERENYSDLLESIKDKFKNEFGQETALTDSDPLGQFAALLAKLQNDNLKLAEALWASRKLSGAEGVYLDDIFGMLGVYRKGKQKGTGSAVVGVDSGVSNSYLFPTTTKFTAANSKSYVAQQDTLLSSSVIAFKLVATDLTIGQQYTLNFKNTETNVTNTYDYTPADDPGRDLVLNEIASTLRTDAPGNDAVIFVDSGSRTLYVGYNSSFTLVGISQSTELFISPVVGNRHSVVQVECEEEGYFPVLSGEITNLSPSFTGYVSATNISPFYSGDEVESDAEYRIRSFKEIKATKAGTRDSIVAAVSELDGVSRVKIYDNPTLSALPEVDARSFNTVVLGGTSSEIAQAIYDTKPIVTATDGTTSVAVATADNDSEVINFTQATEQSIDIRITYTTSGNLPLSDYEKTTIINSIIDKIDVLDIGETLFNTTLVFAVLSSEGAARVISITAEVKLDTEADSLYTKVDKVPNFDQVFKAIESDISFIQELG